MDGLPGATWTMLNRRILIKRTASRSRSSSRSSSIRRRTILAIVVHAIERSWPSSHLKIDRTAWRSCGRTPRSRLDRAAIGEHTWWNRCHSRWGRSTNDHDHDRGAIVTLSRLDRGSLWGGNQGWFGGNWSHDCHQRIKPTPRQIVANNPSPQSRQSATIVGPIFLFKTDVLPFFVLNFWLTREEIKWVSRKISSSSCFPRV